MSAYVGGFLVTLKGLCKPEIRDSKQLFTLSSPNNFHKVPLVAAFCKGKMRHAAVGPFVEIQKHSHTSLFLHSNTTHFDHTAQESYCTVVAQLHERSTLHLAWRRHHQFCGTHGHAEGTTLPPIVNLPLLMRSHASSQKEVNLFASAKELGRNGLSQVLVRRAPLTGSDPLGRATIPLVHFPTCQELQERRMCTARISKWSCLNFPEGRTSSLTGRQGKSRAEPSTQTKLSWILLPGEPPETLSARNKLTYQTFKHFCISFDDCKWPWTSDGTWLSRTGRIRKAQQDLLSRKFWPPLCQMFTFERSILAGAKKSSIFLFWLLFFWTKSNHFQANRLCTLAEENPVRRPEDFEAKAGKRDLKSAKIENLQNYNHPRGALQLTNSHNRLRWKQPEFLRLSCWLLSPLVKQSPNSLHAIVSWNWMKL